jgi:hypothetical protein
VLAHTLSAFGDVIAKPPKLNFINLQHEGGAGSMALGYACPHQEAGVLSGFGCRQRDQFRHRPTHAPKSHIVSTLTT